MQWIDKTIVNRIRERGHANKVSMKKKGKEKEKVGGSGQLFVGRRLALAERKKALAALANEAGKRHVTSFTRF